MFEYFIVYLIIAAAVVYTVYKTIKSVNDKKKSLCDGCSGCDIKHEVLKNQKNNSTVVKSCDSFKEQTPN
jgi:hypothetical protein